MKIINFTNLINVKTQNDMRNFDELSKKIDEQAEEIPIEEFENDTQDSIEEYLKLFGDKEET